MPHQEETGFPHGSMRTSGRTDGPGRESNSRLRDLPTHPEEMEGIPTLGHGRPVNPKVEAYDGTDDWNEYIVYFEQLSELYGWSRPTMAMLLGLNLRGAARTVLTGMGMADRRNYEALKRTLAQNFSPPQRQHFYMAELKARRRKTEESLAELGRDIARLTRLAYPQADNITRETIGINAFLDSLPGPAMEIRLHVTKSHPPTLQEAVACAMEVDVILESQNAKYKRTNVRAVAENERSEFHTLADYLRKLEKRLEEIQKQGRIQTEKPRVRKPKSEIVCYNCGDKGHYKRECQKPPKSGNGQGPLTPQ